MNQGVPEMSCDHLRSLCAFEETRRSALRGVHVRGRYIVDRRCDELDETVDELGGECGGTTVEVVEVLVKRITVKLDSYDFFDGRVGNAQRFLKAFQYSLAILMRVLGGK